MATASMRGSISRATTFCSPWRGGVEAYLGNTPVGSTYRPVALAPKAR